MNIEKQYDLVIHLCGGQTLPIYYGTQLLKAPRHVFAVTKESENQYKALRPLLKKQGISTAMIEVDAYDPAQVREAMYQTQIRNKAAHVALNLTGGTKLMFIGGQQTMAAYGYHAYYFEPKTRAIHFLHATNVEPIATPPVFNSVDPFIRFSGERITRRCHWRDAP